MRITRAAKVAAFPLTVLILVALVACQGPAGLDGAAGGKGDPGSMGTPGTPGTAGNDALTAIGGTTPAVILVNDGKTTAGVITIGDAPPVMDPRDYFAGGTGPFEYKVTRNLDAQERPEPDPAATDTFVAVIPTKNPNKGMLVISIDPDVTAPPDGTNGDDDYTVGSRFMLSVTDANKATISKTLYVLANRDPEAAGAAFTLRVGTQNAEDSDRKAAASNPMCATFDVCAVTPSVSAHRANSADVQFTDDVAGDAVGAVAATASPALTFEIFEVSEDADAVAVSVTPDGKTIMVTGKVATDNGNAKKDDDLKTIIVVRAMDSNGMYTKRDLTVIVDGRPTVKTMLQSKYTIPQFTTDTTPTAGTLTINNIAGFFSDVESGIEIHDVDTETTDTQVKSSDSNIATATVTGNPANLVVTAVNIGTTTITVRAVESGAVNQDGDMVAGLGQWVEQSFTVEVE